MLEQTSVHQACWLPAFSSVSRHTRSLWKKNSAADQLNAKTLGATPYIRFRPPQDRTSVSKFNFVLLDFLDDIKVV